MRPTRCSGGILAAGLLALALLASPVAADSVLEIVGNLKTWREGALELFQTTSENLRKAGATEDADQVEKWSYDWLSVLGTHRGLTGLVKDFVLNYLGRSDYHDHNGNLIAAMNSVSAAFPKRKTGFTSDDAAIVIDKVLDVCSFGKRLFEADGSLHQMLAELQAILKPSNTPHFQKGFADNRKIRKAFEYLAGPRPGATADEL